MGSFLLEKKIISHQLSLNNFALSFRHNYPSDFTYYDEKFVSQIFSDIRPDGIIKLGNNYFFLEMDMCSERKALCFPLGQKIYNPILSKIYGIYFVLIPIFISVLLKRYIH